MDPVHPAYPVHRALDRVLGQVSARVIHGAIVTLATVLGGLGCGAIGSIALAQTPPAPISPPVVSPVMPPAVDAPPETPGPTADPVPDDVPDDLPDELPDRSPELSTIQSLLDRANAATLANQPDLAARFYRQAIALAAADNPQRVVAHLGLGLLLNQQGEPAQAIAQFDQAIALAPTSAIGYELRGLALFDLERWDEAIASLQQAVERDPQNPSIRVSLANVLYERQDFEQAIAQLRLVIDLMPNQPQAHYNLGLALDDRGQLPEAIAQYEQALAIDPQNRDIQAALDRARAALQNRNPPTPPPE